MTELAIPPGDGLAIPGERLEAALVRSRDDELRLRAREDELRMRALTRARNAMAPSTVSSYGSHWRHFTEWCGGMSRSPLPASIETLLMYLVDNETEYKASTLSCRLAAIKRYQELAGFEQQTNDRRVRDVLVGIRRDKGDVTARALPFLIEDIRAAVEALDRDTLAGRRDAALLLVCFAGAFRVSELIGIDVEHFQEIDEGIVVQIPKSKTDQFGDDCVTVGIPPGTGSTCPVTALKDWLTAAGITEGPIFCKVNKWGTTITPRQIGRQTAFRIVKAAAVAAGLDPAKYSTHSLRAGHVTQANINGVADHVIADQTRHKQLSMLRVYRRPLSVFQDNSATYLGL